LVNLQTLDVAGNVTLSAATLGKVETLTVSGALTAAAASYTKVATLEVNGTFDADGKSFGTLQSLTVKTGGAFTAADIGSAAASLTLTVEEGGTATVGGISKLLKGAVSGALTATGLGFDTDGTFTAGAKSTVNGVSFPADAAITGLSGDGVSIGDYTVPEDTALTIAADSTLTIADTKTLTLQTGAGIAGAGTLAAGLTAITGSADGSWQAAGGNIAIGSAATGATIGLPTGVTIPAVLTAVGTPGTAAPIITQSAGTGNNLTIAADVTIALGGTTDKLGEIVLKNSAETNTTDNAKLTLIGTITTGNVGTTKQAAGAPLAADSATEVADANSYTKIGVLYLTGDGTNAKVVVTNDPKSASQSDAGKIAKLFGAASATIAGGDSTDAVDGTKDGKISSVTATVADSTS
jgi:hypothetical protein